MAITFVQQRQKQKNLIILAVILATITLIFIWRNFLVKPEEEISSVAEEVFIPKEIKINFEALNNPILTELQPFEEIPPFEGAVGRANPFILYEISTPAPSPTPQR